VLVQKPTSQQFQEVTGKTQQHFDAWWSRVSESIAPEKDVDCLSPDQLASLERHGEQTANRDRTPLSDLNSVILPATSLAAILMLQEMAGTVENLRTKRVAIIGRSQIVGRPAAAALSLLGVENELMSSASDLPELLPEFDAIISATGKAGLISPESIKQDAWLIDVGAPAPEFQEACREKAQWWTPVPGGVGPVTRACLLENAVRIAR
jgi:methylenetetrahydrofolate dehydrogenase (NADP+)/methenyltetrahydrofolate cyclohydrolase